jgi:hypothetical protein
MRMRITRKTVSHQENRTITFFIPNRFSDGDSGSNPAAPVRPANDTQLDVAFRDG